MITRRKHRSCRLISARFPATSGFTLIEVLVAASIFIVLNGAIFALMGYNQSASEKASANIDAATRVLILFEKMRLELRNARVIDASDTELSYWIYEKDQGSPVFDSVNHRLSFLPGNGLAPDVAKLSLAGSDRHLLRTFQGEQQLLAALDKDGELHFAWASGPQRLRVFGQAGISGRKKSSLEAVKSFSFTFSLNNVE